MKYILRNARQEQRNERVRAGVAAQIRKIATERSAGKPCSNIHYISPCSSSSADFAIPCEDFFETLTNLW